MTESVDAIFGMISMPQGYEGASTNFRRELSGLISGTHDEIATREVRFLISRSAHAIRNNGYASSALDKHVQNLKAVTVTWKDKKGKENSQMNDYWREFADNPNLDGVGDLGLTQTLWQSSLFYSGAAHTRYLIRRTNNPNKIPLKLQMIDTEFHHIGLFRGTSTEDVRFGIKFEDSKPISYFYLPNRFEQMQGVINNPIEIPAHEINHMFIRRFPNQWIGIPMLSPVLLPLYELDDLSDATISKQKAAQALAWIVENSTPGAFNPVGAPVMAGETDASNKNKIVFKAQGGNVQYLNKGERITQLQGSDIGNNLVPFIGSELKRITSALNLPYFQVTGDYSGLDFSTLRGILIELRHRIEYIHHFMTIPLGLKPLCSRFQELATLYYPKASTLTPSFQLPRWYGVDELKDVQAEVLAMQNGLGTLEEFLNARHLSFEQVIQDRQRMQEIGLDNLLYPQGSSMAQAKNNEANPNSTGNT